MIDLVYAPSADDDLLEIFLTIAEDDEGAATRFIDRIRAALRRLADYPLSAPARPELGVDMRSLAVGRYLVLYRVQPDHVLILRVLHGARDIGAALDTEG